MSFPSKLTEIKSKQAGAFIKVNIPLFISLPYAALALERTREKEREIFSKLNCCFLMKFTHFEANYELLSFKMLDALIEGGML